MSNEAIQFDTHQFIKNMTKVGFTEEQAEVIANQQINLINSNLATKEDIASIHADIATTHAEIATIHADIEKLRLATKKDIASIHAEIATIHAEIATIHAEITTIHAEITTIHADIASIHAEIAKLRLETQKDIEKSKVELIKWMVGAMIAQGAVVVSLVVGLMSLIIFNT